MVKGKDSPKIQDQHKTPARLEAGLWTVRPDEFLKTVNQHLREFKSFDPDYFLEVHNHTLRGVQTHSHLLNLCQIMNSRSLCHRCGLVDTDDCTLSISSTKDSIAARILQYVEDDLELFNSSDTAYARLTFREKSLIVPVRSKTMERYLGYVLYQQEDKPPSSESISTAQNVLAAKAIFDGPDHELHVRLAWHDDCLWYDLSNDQGHAVRISADEWEVAECTPVPMFRTFKNHIPAIVPTERTFETTEDLRETLFQVLQFLNYPQDRKDLELLIIILLVSYFIEGIAHPVLVIDGNQGSAKSSFFRVFKMLVDPGDAQTMSFPKGVENLVQALAHQWFIGFDNVSKLKDWQSDFLCRAVTGEGFLKREIWTVDDDVLYKYRRCIGLNGINNVVEKPDLLDRSILITLPSIPDKMRRPERDFFAILQDKAPEILGSVFTVLSRAIKIYPTIELTGLYRLADWTLWGCAIAEAIGVDVNLFLRAYEKNLGRQNVEALDKHLVGTAILGFMEGRFEWRGKMGDLLAELVAVAERTNISTKARKWPKAPHILTRRINEVKVNLSLAGIQVKQLSDGDRTYVISREDPELGVAPLGPRQMALDATDTPADATQTHHCVSENDVSSALDDDSDVADATDATDAETSGVLLKTFEEEDRSSTSIEPLIIAQEKRWEEFLEQTADVMVDDCVSRIDVEKKYPKEQMQRLELDILDWTAEGRLNFLRKRRVWRIRKTRTEEKDNV